MNFRKLGRWEVDAKGKKVSHSSQAGFFPQRESTQIGRPVMFAGSAGNPCQHQRSTQDSRALDPQKG